MRIVAIAGCAALVVFGAVLFGLDVRGAVWGGAQGWNFRMSELVAWRWGVASMIAGVLGWVLVAFGDSLTVAALWVSRDRER